MLKYNSTFASKFQRGGCWGGFIMIIMNMDLFIYHCLIKWPCNFAGSSQSILRLMCT